MYSKNATYYDADRKIWSGQKQKDYFGPDMTLGEVALHVLSRIPNKVVQVMDTTGEELTADQLLRDAKAVAKSFQRMGLKVGDVIGISANNTTNLAAVLLGALLCGTPTNALYPEFEQESVEIIFKVTTPKLIFCDAENFKTMKEAATAIALDAEIITIAGEIEGVRNVKDLLRDNEEVPAFENNFPCHTLTGDDTAVIICSSGTTGPPKGVCCSHRALLNQPLFPNLSADAIIFSSSTMYWISGVWNFISNITTGAKRIITNLPVSAEYYMELIEKHKITHAMGAPSQTASIVQHATPDATARLESIDEFYCGGSKVSKTLAEKMTALLGEKPRNGFIVAYGMTELSGALCENRKEQQGERCWGNEGKLRPNKEVRILSKTGEPLGINETGLISIRLRYKWPGYYRKPEATVKTCVDGWLLTSDLGFFDEAGNLNVCTRDSDVFKSNNFQVYPELIEEAILELPGVEEACVFGIPDDIAGNLVSCAVVRMKNDAGKQLTEHKITEHVAKKISKVFHIKGGVYFINSLPRTASDKLQRRKVWETVQNAK